MTVGYTRKRMEGQAVIVKDSLLTQQLGVRKATGFFIDRS
jgi:hypothetical protein